MKEANHARSVDHSGDLCLYSEILGSFVGLWKYYSGAGWSSHWRKPEVSQERHLGAVPVIKLQSLGSAQLSSTQLYYVL